MTADSSPDNAGTGEHRQMVRVRQARREGVRPAFRTDAGHLPALAAQRLDAQALAADAEARGWITEAERHRRLIERLDAHIAQVETG